MNAQFQPSPPPSLQPADFLDPTSFVVARRNAWNQVAADINPGNQVLPILELAWINEWMDHHAKRIGDAIRCVAGLPPEEVARYAAMGGLRQFVADYRAVRGTNDALKDHVEALQAALRSIADHRHRHAATQTPEQMLEGIALKAFEAMAYGRLPEPAASAAPAADSDAASPEVDAEALEVAATLIEQARTDAQLEGEPRAAPHDDETAEDAQKRRFHTRVEDPTTLMTAQRFMSMAGIRNLTDADGVAYLSDGTHYDTLTPLSPEKPLPHGTTHVVWKEYAAQPIKV